MLPFGATCTRMIFSPFLPVRSFHARGKHRPVGHEAIGIWQRRSWKWASLRLASEVATICSGEEQDSRIERERDSKSGTGHLHSKTDAANPYRLVPDWPVLPRA